MLGVWPSPSGSSSAEEDGDDNYDTDAEAFDLRVLSPAHVGDTPMHIGGVSPPPTPGDALPPPATNDNWHIDELPPPAPRRYDASEEEDIDGDYGQFVTNLRRKRQQVIAWHVVETSLRAKTEHRQKSGPQGPKKNISDPAFNWERHVDKLTRGAFRRRYRMDVSSFDKLLDKIRPHLSRKDEGMAKRNRKAGAVSDEVTLAITLRYLAGSMVEDLYLVYAPISRARVYTCLWDGINAVNRAFAIDNPYGDTENACDEGKLSTLEATFRAHTRKQEFVGIVGALDGTIIKMNNPGLSVANPQAYRVETKSCYGLKVMAICDYDRRFTWFDISSVSRTHDSKAFKATPLGKHIYEGSGLPHPYFFLSDAAFELHRNVIKPTSTRDRNKCFDFLQSSYRMPIECAFGMLARRWGVFCRPLEVMFKRRAALIECAMKLHNFCIDEKVPAPEAYLPAAGNAIEATAGQGRGSNRWIMIPEDQQEANRVYRVGSKRVTMLDGRGHRDAPPLGPGAHKRARRNQLLEKVADLGMQPPSAART